MLRDANKAGISLPNPAAVRIGPKTSSRAADSELKNQSRDYRTASVPAIEKANIYIEHVLRTRHSLHEPYCGRSRKEKLGVAVLDEKGIRKRTLPGHYTRW